MAVVAFSGSRSCLRASSLASSLARALPSHTAVFVGCAAGSDAAVRFVRRGSDGLRVFSAVGHGAAALVGRSVALVRSLVGLPGACLFCLPLGACPPSCVPAPVWRGSGSGSWGSAALAAWLGVPVVLFGVAAPPWGGLGFVVRSVRVFGVAGWLVRRPKPALLF